MQVINQQVDKQVNHIIYGLIGTLLIITLLSGFSLSLASVFATAGTASDSTMATASVTVAASCSMTATIDTAHSGNVPNGVYSGGNDYYPSGIGETTIATRCNDPSGYSIYAIGVAESGSNDNTALYSSILGNTYNIGTGVYQAGTTTNSTWSMKVNKVTDSSSYLPSNLTIQNSFDSYHAVPAAYTEVARFSSATDVTLGSKIKTTYDAYIDGDQPAGTYKGHVKYTLVHPGGTDVPDVGTMQTVANWGGRVGVGETVTATDSRDGNTYKVTGICTQYNATNPNNCDHYELWMTENLDLALSTSGAIKTDGITTTTLTSANTDLNTYGSGAFTNAYGYNCSNSAPDCAGGTITWTPGSTLASPATISNFAYSSEATNVVSGWANDGNQPHWAEGRLNGNASNEVYINNSNIYTKLTAQGDSTACTTNNTPDQCAHWHVGNYYNWPAAVATNNASSYNTQYTSMPNSICPAGWHLPKGLTGTSGNTVMSDFNQVLLTNGVTGDGGKDASGTTTTDGIDLYGSTNVKYSSTGWSKMIGDPFYFVRSGGVAGTTLYNSTGGGLYWSSTVATSGNAYYLYFPSSGLYPANVDRRGNGFSVRCIASLP